ncbi:hypothetical protein [Sphingobium cupriresistens]|uniref:Uncharacterized protein n=1 Tax=Sphingobium cupriresistens LL01 TaxID=1420583 RepID=A0A0J7Y538_9SPHN|nr:hypothetical protein [Sphingobium cupriresistens]KMS58782.1 hypothetical protein V473_07185 [Sphingobium cupriresistens LL01]
MLHPIAAFAAHPSDFTRAQILIQGHIAQIDAALVQLRLHRASMVPSIADMHEAGLHRYRDALIRDLDAVLAAPDGAQGYAGVWGGDGHGPRIADACEAVDRSISKRNAYRDMLAARRGSPTNDNHRQKCGYCEDIVSGPCAHPRCPAKGARK